MVCAECVTPPSGDRNQEHSAEQTIEDRDERKPAIRGATKEMKNSRDAERGVGEQAARHASDGNRVVAQEGPYTHCVWQWPGDSDANSVGNRVRKNNSTGGYCYVSMKLCLRSDHRCRR